MNYTETTIYNLHQSFANGLQTSDVTIRPLYELVVPAYVTPPPDVDNGMWLYDSNGSWGAEAGNYLRDSNIMALIENMTSPLLGSYNAGGNGQGRPNVKPINDGSDGGIEWLPAF